MGHWRKTVRSSTEPARIQLQHILNKAPNLSADTVNDKYFIDCNFFNCYENNVTEFENKLITLKTANYMVALKVLKVT